MKFALIGDATLRSRFLHTLLYSDDETVQCKKQDGRIDLINGLGILHLYQVTIGASKVDKVDKVDICNLDCDLKETIKQGLFKEYSAIIYVLKKSENEDDPGLERIEEIIDSVDFYTDEKPTDYIKELIVTCKENEKKELAKELAAQARTKATIIEAEQTEALGRSIETRLSDYYEPFFDEVSETASSEETAEEPIATIFPA